MERHLIALLHSSLQLHQFKQIHALIVTKYPTLTSFFVGRLLNLSIVDYSRKIFDHILQPDESINISIISTYSKLSLSKEAVDVFSLMHRNTSRISFYVFAPVIKSCASLQATDEGKQIHSLVTRYGFESDVFVQTAFIDFYAKTGELGSARRIFDAILIKDAVSYNCLMSAYSRYGEVFAARRLFDEMTERTVGSWNSMISCYAQNGDFMKGLRIFERMQEEKCLPNEVTLVTILSICAKLGDLEMGLRVKNFIEDNNLCQNMVLSTAILEMYVKCGAVDDARREFDQMTKRDVVAWSTMIAGYSQNGRPNEAIELFECMKTENYKPNDVALVSVLSACAQLGSIEAGESIGSYIESHCLSLNVYVGSALLDMYAKCGNIQKACVIFGRMSHRDIVCWNSMMLGLAINGFADEAIDLYNKMSKTNMKPDNVTFIGLLTACSHAGLFELGLAFFKSMTSDHDIIPKIEHFACIVDLFCRSGRLKEAYEFICKMDLEPNVVIWGTLLSACRTHLNVELAERSVENILTLEPENSWSYEILSNIYGSVGRWQEALKIRPLVKDKRMQKAAAYSWIEM